MVYSGILRTRNHEMLGAEQPQPIGGHDSLYIVLILGQMY